MMSVIFRGRQFSSSHVHLNRRQDQFGKAERFISRISHHHKVGLGDTIMNMDVRPFLYTYSRFPSERIASSRFVIVAQEHSGLVRQLEYFLN